MVCIRERIFYGRGDCAARREREQSFHAISDVFEVVEVLEEAKERRD
jgi:hypothetical protein